MHSCVKPEITGRIETVGVVTVAGRRKRDLFLSAVMHAVDASRVIAGKGDYDDGAAMTRKLGSTRITMISAGAQSAVQASSPGRRNGSLHVCASLAGALTVDQDGRRAELVPGQMAMFDSTRPFGLAMHGRFQMVTVRLTHHTAGIGSRHTGPLTGIPWEGTSGVGAIASNLLAALGEHLAELDCTSIDPLDIGVRNTMMSLIAERLCHAKGDAVPSAEPRQILMIRIQAWAREHLSDMTLTPRELARQHNISLRYLQMLFAEQGTSPARWIRDERLAHCYEDLRDPRYDHLTIAAIGARWGLCGGASALSHVFREQYGCPPGEVRRRRQVTAVT